MQGELLYYEVDDSYSANDKNMLIVEDWSNTKFEHIDLQSGIKQNKAK